MKHLLSLTLFFIYSFVSFGQSKKNFTAIDAKSKSIGYLPLNELTKKLTVPYSDDMDKARAIYSWIAYHVAYDDAEFEKEDPLRYDKHKFANISSQVVFDSLWDVEHANFALKNHRGICGEYAALFKVMCDLASIQCVIVDGYGKWYEWIGQPYEENHSWNALFLKGKWQLSDITWGAGYWDEKKKKSVQHFNPFYFCTPPDFFINDHYPALLKWSLIDHIITRGQFEKAIYFNYDAGNKTQIGNVIPKIGLLKKKVGDSISFEIETTAKCFEVALHLNDSVERISYKPPAEKELASLQNRRQRVAVKSISVKDVKSIDALFNVIDNTEDTIKDAKGKKIIPSSIKTQLLGADAEGVRYFKEDGSKISFKYYIKNKGDFLVTVFLNLDNVMTYRLIVE